MYFKYIFYWVVWDVIKYNFVQVIVIRITLLFTFLHSLRKPVMKEWKSKFVTSVFQHF